MNTYQYFIWLAEQALLIYALPFNIALLAVIILITRGNILLGKKEFLVFPLAVAQFLIPIIMVLLGTWFRNDTRHPDPSTVVGTIVLCLFVFQIPISIYLLFRIKDDRLLVAALTGVQLFVSFVAMIVAGMSISGDWI